MSIALAHSFWYHPVNGRTFDRSNTSPCNGSHMWITFSNIDVCPCHFRHIPFIHNVQLATVLRTISIFHSHRMDLPVLYVIYHKHFMRHTRTKYADGYDWKLARSDEKHAGIHFFPCWLPVHSEYIHPVCIWGYSFFSAVTDDLVAPSSTFWRCTLYCSCSFAWTRGSPPPMSFPNRNLYFSV